VRRTFFGTFTRSTICPECGGEGYRPEKPCNVCNGEGRIRGEEEVALRIPAGVDTGQVLKFEGKGDAGRRGGKPGDLLVRVIVRPHPIFERKGDDLYLQVPISFSQATLGDAIEVETLGRVKNFIKSSSWNRFWENFENFWKRNPPFQRTQGEVICTSN
jgi:molecular chaperone DnaJ